MGGAGRLSPLKEYSLFILVNLKPKQMKFSEYPFMRYTLFFILGVLLYPYGDFLGLVEIATLTGILFLVYLSLLLANTPGKPFRYQPLFPAVAYVLLVSMGFLFTFLRDASNEPSHLLYHGKIEGYIGTVDDLDQQKPNTFANRVLVSAVKNDSGYFPAIGEVIIYHKLSEKLLPGEIVWIQGTPSIIPPPKNPNEFNYHRFLANQQIYHSHFIDNKIERLGRQDHSPINNRILQLRASIQDQMDKYIPTPHSNQIAKALLLGQNKYLDKEVSEAYITAGTMHVLAVSGLHVGIVYGFFFLFVKPYQLPGHKRVLYISFLIGIIWIYALITGMSPSVLRAATMFTLMGLAQMKSRSPSIYNSLALSALILMVFDPYIFYSVGFQLSYLAVFGIVLLQPKISEMWQPKSKINRYFWDITSVGIAAQLATFPISVHYFHVFPTYFMLSNLIAIPGAFLIMSFGIPFMLLASVEPIGRVLGRIVDYLIIGENWVMFSFQDLPLARIEHIHLPPFEMLFVWSLIISVYMLTLQNRRKYAYFSLFLFCGLMVSNWAALWKDYRRNELYIYHVNKEVAVDHFYQGKLYSRVDILSPQDISYKVSPNRISKGHSQAKELRYLEEGSLKSFFLPGGSFLQLHGDGFEIEAPLIKSISQYEEGKWLATDALENKEAAYRVIIR